MENNQLKIVEQFIEMLIAERGASANTSAAYFNDITNFEAFQNNAGQNLAGATTDHVRSYLRHRTETGAHSRTISRNLSVLRQFFKFYKVRISVQITQLLMLTAQKLQNLSQN